mmetsp:Transcript_11464/g.25562  ORF Transcript_11464/g.25562 Transcript_11464/m.25562 type:complete len:96 (+) Transcript_11464:1058-1345(+)
MRRLQSRGKRFLSNSLEMKTPNGATAPVSHGVLSVHAKAATHLQTRLRLQAHDVRTIVVGQHCMQGSTFFASPRRSNKEETNQSFQVNLSSLHSS